MYKVDRRATGPEYSDAQEAWGAWVSELHGRFRFSFDQEGYTGQIIHQASSAYELVEWTGNSETLTRSEADIRRDPRGDYRLLVPVTGVLRIEQSGQEGWLRPGELALVPTDFPLRLAHGTGVSSLAMIVPGDRLEQRFGPGIIPGHRTLGDVGLPRIVRDLVLSLAEQRDALTGAEFDSACDRVVDLFCLAAIGQTSVPDRASDAAVREAISRYVREHSQDPDITVTRMAAQIGWSVRQVQAVLARYGTTASELIRNERLELARIRLANPAFASQGIARIAHSVGFSSAGAFSTAYRRRFGCAPSDFRAAAQDSPPEGKT